MNPCGTARCTSPPDLAGAVMRVYGDLMRTTVDLPQDVRAVVREIARREGRSMGAVLAGLAREGLAARSAPGQADRRTGLRQIRIGRPVTADDVAAAQED